MTFAFRVAYSIRIVLTCELNVAGHLCKQQVQGLNGLFGEYLTRCLYSKTWSLREAAVLKVPSIPWFVPRVCMLRAFLHHGVNNSFGKD